jgi:hypothetical protein
MGAKSKTRFTPHVMAGNEYISKPETYPLCEGKSCRNVVSRWLEPRLCSRCRKRKPDER